jgi:hypothetical protein
MIFSELIKRVPDYLFVNLCRGLITKQAAHPRNRRLPVAKFPNQSCRLIQTMSLIPLAVIHQQFAG